jgi:hypothetical protein
VSPSSDPVPARLPVVSPRRRRDPLRAPTRLPRDRPTTCGCCIFCSFRRLLSRVRRARPPLQSRPLNRLPRCLVLVVRCTPPCGLRPLRLGSRQRPSPSFRQQPSHTGATSLPPRGGCGVGGGPGRRCPPSLPHLPSFQRPVLQWCVAGLSPPGGVRATVLAFCVCCGGAVSVTACSLLPSSRALAAIPIAWSTTLVPAAGSVVLALEFSGESLA